MERRKDLRSNAKTGDGKYSSKYALSGLLVCSECGSKFRRFRRGLADGTYEIAVIGKRYEEKHLCEMENIICLAWHTEAFARQKKLPRLSKLIKDVRKKPKKQNSKSDMILKAMAAAKGVTIK